MNRNVKKSGGAAAGKNLCRMGVGVIAGGLMFVGQAEAAPLIHESFESSPSALFGAFASYAYAENYTSANVPPDAGLRYFTGTSGQATQTRTGDTTITDQDNGAEAAEIDAGLANYNLSAYFSGYATQGDFSEVRLRFKDGLGSDVGDVVTIGGQQFVASLGLGLNAAGAPGYKDWGLDSASGVIPAGARAVDLEIYTQRAEGTAADGYLALLRLDVTVVPEPSAVGLAAFAAGWVGLRRRRRST